MTLAGRAVGSAEQFWHGKPRHWDDAPYRARPFNEVMKFIDDDDDYYDGDEDIDITAAPTNRRTQR